MFNIDFTGIGANTKHGLTIGDKVMIMGPSDGNDDVTFKTGTIKNLGYGTAGVEFDEKINNGHNLDGLCKYGYGWNCDFKWVQVVEKVDLTEKPTILRRQNPYYRPPHAIVPHVYSDRIEIEFVDYKSDRSKIIFKRPPGIGDSLAVEIAVGLLMQHNIAQYLSEKGEDNELEFSIARC